MNESLSSEVWVFCVNTGEGGSNQRRRRGGKSSHFGTLLLLRTPSGHGTRGRKNVGGKREQEGTEGGGQTWTRLTSSVTLTETNNMADTDTQTGNRSWTQRQETHRAVQPQPEEPRIQHHVVTARRPSRTAGLLSFPSNFSAADRCDSREQVEETLSIFCDAAKPFPGQNVPSVQLFLTS